MYNKSVILNSSAFTLAEVLITLAIIGVVAALTIPTLINTISDMQYKSAWKKEFSVISQAYQKAKTDNGGSLNEYFNTGTSNSVAPVVELMGNFLSYTDSCNIPLSVNFTTVCGTSQNISDVYKTMANTPFSTNQNQYNLASGQYIMNDGSIFYFRTYNPSYLLVWVDVNGLKGPNIQGKDLFGATITSNKVLPMGAAGSGTTETCGTSFILCGTGFHASSDCSGAGCSLKYLME